jgi:hypothetical protein
VEQSEFNQTALKFARLLLFPVPPPFGQDVQDILALGLADVIMAATDAFMAEHLTTTWRSMTDEQRAEAEAQGISLGDVLGGTAHLPQS